MDEPNYGRLIHIFSIYKCVIYPEVVKSTRPLRLKFWAKSNTFSYIFTDPQGLMFSWSPFHIGNSIQLQLTFYDATFYYTVNQTWNLTFFLCLLLKSFMQGLCAHMCIYVHLQVYMCVQPVRRSRMMAHYHFADRNLKKKKTKLNTEY